LVSHKDYPEEKTEVIYGIENITQATLERFSSTKVNIDSCIDPLNPSTIMNAKPIVGAITDQHKRGIKSRVITEITKDNLHYCKELMKIITELRHLDEVKGNFSVSDQVIYQATATGNFLIPDRVPSSMLSSKLDHNSYEAKQSTQSIFSTVRAFVEQQQYFFDMLWKKAIPAKQRIKEIEEGLKREFIETIRDPVEIQNLIPKVIDSATEELAVIFSTTDSFIRYKEQGIVELLTQKSDNGVNTRILIKNDHDNDNGIEDNVKELTVKHPTNLKVQYLNNSVKTKVATFLADNELSLVIELKEDANIKDISNEEAAAVGLATYSNSESTVLSNASIFETLWLSQSNLPTPV
jgi:two-component system, OmpR family, sensor histidine kinase VicK